MKIKNKFLCFVLALCLIIPCALMFTGCDDKDRLDVWDGKVGNISQTSKEISIETAEELAALAESVNEGNTYEGVKIKLIADIDLKNIEWTPIGYGSNSGDATVDANGAVFKGIFDGRDHTIYNLKITEFVGGSATEGAATGVGLFGNIHGATIKNLDIENATVHGNHYVGAAVGFARASTLYDVDVEDVEVVCTYSGGNEEGDKAGAVIGFMGNSMLKDGIVKYCDAEDSTVSAARDAGQVIGCLSTDNYGAEVTTSATQSKNDADDVVVTDNETNEDGKNDNVKNDIVGRVKG